ncbi:MAG TPA: SNF2-related protein [Thermoanaerobaculia bacterium]|nr:SNF2-related protein [Thermoanaerobaculia bacterium]
MLSLTSRCAGVVSWETAARGEQYARTGRVGLLRTKEDEAGLITLVRGSGERRYQVQVHWDDVEAHHLLKVHCECPAAERGPCKHVWATLAEMERQGLGSRVPGTGRLRVEIRRLGRPPKIGLGASPSRFLASRWRQQVSRLRDAWRAEAAPPRPSQPVEEIWLLADPSQTLLDGSLNLRVMERPWLKSGRPGRWRSYHVQPHEVAHFPRELQDALHLLQGLPSPDGWSYAPASSPYRTFTVARVPSALVPLVLPVLCATGRFAWWPQSEEAGPEPIRWDAGPPWQVELAGEEEGDAVHLTGRLARDGESRPLAEATVLLRAGAVFFTQEAARLEVAEVFPWVSLLRRDGAIDVPRGELREALESLLTLPNTPALQLPEPLMPTVATGTARPVLTIRAAEATPQVLGRLSFEYGGERIEGGDPRRVIHDPASGHLVRRDLGSERELARTLRAAGWQGEGFELSLPTERFVEALEGLLERGVRVEAAGRPLRSPGRVGLSVSSGRDWFDLEGKVEFGDVSATLPELLQAVQERSSFVVLGDGSLGLLPAEWLRRFGPLAGVAAEGAEGRVLRFDAHQALVLDALLAAEPEVEVDAVFRRAREQLRSFSTLEPQAAPKGFRGTLRPYQEIGLAWLWLLSELGLGGCLADDMGLGKTIQVLAFLLDRKRRRQTGGRPSLLVVPASLVANWLAEALRFTPSLRVTALHGAERHGVLEGLERWDVLVTTYATLRRDLEVLRAQELDVLVLDEAQAIKNAGSLTAKACRLLTARQRLALTGTPVENHLGELWSIFEFLNPGLLGRLPALSEHAGKVRLPPEALATVAQALGPLILRRTKAQVLADLPEKTEQTLLCELGAAERKRYDQLRRYYRDRLEKRIADLGLGRSKFLVLEALLRLRQAACHPALVDPRKRGEKSAKLELLAERLDEVLEGGHKALVFSQFVELLTLVRERLDARAIPYEYLDGRTRDRQERVDRFQTDPDCPLFLISLKAGGVGLNLTAASHVFLLDPWWNPAVETQAIDRTHRIGQRRPVFAYRLIARDTVEEKILDLQQEKRELAEAILGGDGRVMKQLTAEDLQRLLG